MKIFLLGAGGFIGSHLVQKVLETSDYEISAFDINTSRLAKFIGNKRFTCFQGDIFHETDISANR